MDHFPGTAADYANATASDALRKAERALRETDRLNMRAVVTQLGYKFIVDDNGNVSVAVPQ